MDGNGETIARNSSIINPATGLQFEGQVIASGKGGMNDESGVMAWRNALIPSFENAAGLNEEFIMPEEPAWRHKKHWASRTIYSDDILHGDRGQPGTKRKRRPTVVGDGHGSHFSPGALEMLTSKKGFKKCCPGSKIEQVDFVLRVPHSSHMTQGEDVVNCEIAKREWRKQQARKMQDNVRQLRHRIGPF